MKFTETPLKGAYIIDPEPRADERGWFSRFFCQREFDQHGLCRDVVQINNSLNKFKGTLRGLHYQLPPKAEDKIVRCVRGALLDVIVDLRSDSPTFLQHYFVELTAENRRMLYVPKRFATGLFTLMDDTETIYLTTQFYSPEQERGLRYNDPRLGIKWPGEPAVISDKDLKHPDFNPEIHLR